MRSNLIGHTIFFTSEKYRMTNQKPDTIFFTSEKIRIGFSRLSRRSCEVIESECLQRSLLSQSIHKIIASRFADINSVEQFIEDHENENTRKKTQQNVALLKEFLTLRNEERPQFIQLVRPQVINKASKQCRSLPLLLFMVVNSTFLSAALINHRPWPLQKLR